MLDEQHSQYQQVAVTRAQTESQISHHIRQFVLTGKSPIANVKSESYFLVTKDHNFSPYFTEKQIFLQIYCRLT